MNINVIETVVGGVTAGSAATRSRATASPDWNSAQCTGLALSISAQGSSFTMSGIAGISSSGQAYVAMATPDDRNVMRRALAISRKNVGKNSRIETH
ncbi:hypothetical protein RY831_24260 [Noviherbaspirillum sp. CPCC 100848]|uniref:Uncharacterized protein n=1 Tax=Noviherbaspirillum album TaxID=3080276 RepID=A0ABU6JF52_9BURK|nr:hypothetical protein [Noviherbaspirillum sp. CPCC 100848]MEC4722282.1 hypothetical protein [Noviherbaspirillum sp. CPCC 100848]